MTASVSKHVWVAAYFRRDDRVLVRRRGPGFDAAKYGPPGGHVEPGESLAEALSREVSEETGLRVVRARLVAIYDTPAGVCFFYRVFEAHGELTTEQGHADWEWLPMGDLRDPRTTQGALAAWHGGRPARCTRIMSGEDVLGVGL
jgi:8-oxo-dGTP pyrophosphatase MutT (NUDIX family)